jgi:hypothetical protein
MDFAYWENNSSGEKPAGIVGPEPSFALDSSAMELFLSA